LPRISFGMCVDREAPRREKWVVPQRDLGKWVLDSCMDNLLYKFTCSVCLSVRRQFCTDTAFSVAEPAGGGETHASRTGLFYGRTRRWRLSVCRGPETQIPTVRLSRSWNPDLN
jgi:hypothetical protein